MKRITNKNFLAGLISFALIVAVTLGVSFGWHYQDKRGGEGYSDTATGATPGGAEEENADVLAAASPLAEDGALPDGVTDASPAQGSAEGTSPDAVTSPSPLSGTEPSPTAPPDGVTGPTPAPSTPDPTTPPPDAETGPSPAPSPAPTPTPPPDAETGPSPAPDPSTVPPPEPEEEDEEEEDDDEEAFNLWFLISLMGMLGMTLLGTSIVTRRKR